MNWLTQGADNWGFMDPPIQSAMSPSTPAT